MANAFAATSKYYQTFLETANAGNLSDKPELICEWYDAIREQDISKMEKLISEHPIPGFFESVPPVGFGGRKNIYEAIRYPGSNFISGPTIKFLLKKMIIPAEYRGVIAVELFYSASQTLQVKKLLDCIRHFKPEDILVVPNVLEYIMFIFPITDPDYLEWCCYLIRLLEVMFPNDKLYDKLSDSKKQIISRENDFLVFMKHSYIKTYIGYQKHQDYFDTSDWFERFLEGDSQEE